LLLFFFLEVFAFLDFLINRSEKSSISKANAKMKTIAQPTSLYLARFYSFSSQGINKKRTDASVKRISEQILKLFVVLLLNGFIIINIIVKVTFIRIIAIS